MNTQVVQISSDSAITSGAMRLPVNDFSERRIRGVATDFGQEITHYAAARAFINPDLTGRIAVGPLESTPSWDLNSNLLINSSEFFALVRTFQDEMTYMFRIADRPEFKQFTISNLVVAHGPSEATSTIPTWTLLPEAIESVGRGLEDLSASVREIGRGLVPRRPQSLLDLARQAAGRLAARQDEDVEEWANRLAQDITNVDE